MIKKHLTPEILVPRLGEYLVQQGYITEVSLEAALARQRKKPTSGKQLLLGEVLVEMGLIDRSILDQVITEQIIQLRSALENSNRFLERRVQERTAELREALERLSELNRMKANFVANISHELRTPLTHIKGYLDLLTDPSLGPLTKDQQEALNVSLRAANRLENLINNLILFALAARGEMALRLSAVDIGKVAGDVARLADSKALDKNVALHVELEANLPPVKADEEKLSWVILQVLDNAIKFTPSGGMVTLSVQLETETLVTTSVSDTGIGIPPERLNEIFEPFHQLNGSSTRRYGGTGLGLALAKEILDAHGSMIDVKSEQGKGTVLKFPLLVVSDPG